MAQTFITGNGDNKRTLVAVFLRGGADGLNIVAPLGDDQYHQLRPRIRIKPEEAVPLDGFFGFHPLLRPLEPAWKDGALAIIHGAGSEDRTRSHFDAQDLMEHGGLAAGGWMGRFLRARPTTAGALACVAIGPALPEAMLGAPSAIALDSLDTFAFAPTAPGLRGSLEKLYAGETGALGTSARDTFDALRRMDGMRAQPYSPAHSADYGKSKFGRDLRQVAQLIKADVGVEAVSVDLDGWDSHIAQDSVMNPRLTALAEGLAAFRQDLAQRMENVTVVVMTEFGRRVAENPAFGTEHGRGSVMFVLGGGVAGGRVHCDWSGLKADSLEWPGDLPVQNNYRDVLAPVLLRHGIAANTLGSIFPEHTPKPLPIYG